MQKVTVGWNLQNWNNKHILYTIMFKHLTPIQIRFNDIDRLGHVNNNAYFAYYDLGKEKYIIDVLKVNYATGQILPVIANINADFCEPMFYGDQIIMQTRVSRIGNKSFTLEQQAVNQTTGHIMCKCSTVMVFMDISAQKSVPMPQEFRQAIEDFEGIKSEITPK